MATRCSSCGAELPEFHGKEETFMTRDSAVEEAQLRANRLRQTHYVWWSFAWSGYVIRTQALPATAKDEVAIHPVCLQASRAVSK